MHHQSPIRLLHFDPSTIGFEHRRQYLAVHIELKLFRSGVPDAYRDRLFVAGQPGNFGFVEAAFAANTVHDLHLSRASSNSTEQPLSPSLSFLAITCAQEREPGERGVS